LFAALIQQGSVRPLQYGILNQALNHPSLGDDSRNAVVAKEAVARPFLFSQTNSTRRHADPTSF
jgi:hypothetical protein